MTTPHAETEFTVDGLPLTAMQQGMVYASLEAPAGSGAYIEQVVGTVQSAFNQSAFIAAWQGVIERHDALRISFRWRGLPEAWQLVAEALAPSIEVQDWSGLSTDAIVERLAAYLAEDRQSGIDLSAPPLHRVAVFITGENAWQFVWTVHHAIIDGRGIATVLREVMTQCLAVTQGTPSPELLPAASFGKFAHSAPALPEDAEAFWQAALGGMDEPCALPLAAPKSFSPSQPEVRFSVEAEQLRTLESFARAQGVTLGTLIHGAWAVLLHRYTGASQVVFGATRSVAPRDAQSRVGLYINTLPLVARVGAGDALGDWLRGLRSDWLAQRAYADTPLQQIQRWSGLPGGTALFDTYTMFERGRLDDLVKANAPCLRDTQYELHEYTPSPLTLAAYQHEGLDLHFEYDPARFAHGAVVQIAGHFVALLTAFPGSESLPLSALPMLSPEERAQLLPPVPHDAPVMPVHERIAARAARRPKAIALQHRHETMRYGEMEQRSNRMAHALRSRGVGPGCKVALCLPRSIDAIVMLLAVLKAGAAYVPIMPGLPLERRRFKCADSHAMLLVGLTSTIADMEREGMALLALDEAEGFETNFPDTPPDYICQPEDLAYVIYTSGSTGQPKGVAVSHGALSAFVDGARQLYALRGKDRVLQFASFSFDAAIEEIYPTLSCGARLVLRTEEMLDSATGFIEQCRAWGITVLDLPTAFWHVVVESIHRIPWPPGLRLVIIGGEAAHTDKVLRWQRHVGAQVQLANTYGPTETTVAVTCMFLEQEAIAGPVPIGWPFPHAAAYVLSPSLEPTPNGVPGELCIAGPQLAQGYLGQQALTDAAFVIAPWDDATRLYRTGDRVHRRDDDALVYLGRIDRQVKLRGFRIELGEIESCLRTHPAVADAAVVVREDQPGAAVLCGYYVVVESVGDEELRAHLAQTLPTYMQPAHLMALPALPLTPNGKLDRNALPLPQRIAMRTARRPPQSEMESQLLALWQEVFGSEDIGCDDAFLDIGGHSLLAVQIVTRMAEQLGVGLSLAEFFKASTVAGLAECVSRAPRVSVEPIPVVAAGAQHPLTPDQEILWVFESLYPGTPAYHIPIAFRLVGRVDADLLARGLELVVARHEPLRSVFELVGDSPLMQVLPQVVVPWHKEASTDSDTDTLRAWLARMASLPFDITRGPLIRGALLQLSSNDYVVCVTVHHLVSDGWSVGTLVREWSEACRALASGGLPEWPPLPLRYADYAAWQRGRAPVPGDTTDQFWQRQLAAPVPRFEGPEQEDDDDPRQGAQYPVQLGRATSDGLARLAQAQGATPFAVLFTLYALALLQMTKQREGMVGLSLAGRTRAELEPLVGFLISTLVLRVRVDDALTFDALLRQVRDDLLEAQQHQHTPYARQRELSPDTPGGAPLLQALFLMQTMPLPPLDIEGVQAQTLQVDMGKALTEITLELYPSAEGFAGWFEYQTDSFARVTVGRLAAYFEQLAQATIAQPGARLADLPAWDDCPAPDLLAEAPALTAPAPPSLLLMQRSATPENDTRPPDELELRLLREFERVLRAKGLTVHDNFFDNGGHSLLVILLLDRIEREFGVRLPPVRVYHAPTARELARYIRDTSLATESRVLKAIRPEGTRTPLFFVGSTDMAPPLLPHMQPDQPVYGLNIFGLLPETGPVPELTVSGIAKAYIPEVLAVQPKGPYRFTAYCRDTMLALELAQQMMALGHEVDRLIVIDFFWESESRHSSIVRHLINLRDFGWQYAAEKVEEFVRKLQEQYARARARVATRKVAADGAALSESNRNTAFIQAYYDAVSEYNVAPYQGHINIILVTEWGLDDLPEWEDVAQEGITIRLLKACHHNLWNSPQDQDLAALITACLADTDTQPGQLR